MRRRSAPAGRPPDGERTTTALGNRDGGSGTERACCARSGADRERHTRLPAEATSCRRARRFRRLACVCLMIGSGMERRSDAARHLKEPVMWSGLLSAIGGLCVRAHPAFEKQVVDHTGRLLGCRRCGAQRLVPEATCCHLVLILVSVSAIECEEVPGGCGIGGKARDAMNGLTAVFPW